MSVRLFYVDESHNDEKYVLSAISILAEDWPECQSLIREHRKRLKEDYGMYLRKEIHATEFVAGRGRIANQVIGKHQRSRIFAGLLNTIATLPNVRLFNVCLNIRNRRDPQMDAWNRMINRIERTMLEVENRETPARRTLLSGLPDQIQAGVRVELERRILPFASRAVIVADQGREDEITKTLRRMNVFNPIPSQFGQWAGGQRSQNIGVRRIIEDPIFKESHQSYMIQLADCVGFALLKREVQPTPNIKKYGIHTMFDQYLAGVCYKAASRADPLGIVRN